ncbi:hypothetical protein BDU57DRAFT_508893 [Ampelomyces quisqualis]|uniref:Uncharacterized protein n=1 Tax=Ampelomyces quisqualis TaxID=50730 RepID=A0A6A5R0A7_AMPQU|nr:hypothetical protein BDU57DRAFT_508893 [Ampelomyces quisqualis]
MDMPGIIVGPFFTAAAAHMLARYADAIVLRVRHVAAMKVLPFIRWQDLAHLPCIPDRCAGATAAALSCAGSGKAAVIIIGQLGTRSVRLFPTGTVYADRPGGLDGRSIRAPTPVSTNLSTLLHVASVPG